MKICMIFQLQLSIEDILIKRKFEPSINKMNFQKITSKKQDYSNPTTRDTVRNALDIYNNENAEINLSDKYLNANFSIQHLIEAK